MEPRPSSGTRARRHVAVIASLGVALTLGGCASPWADHYEGSRLSALGAGAPVDLEPASAADVMIAKSGDGWTRLGESMFTQTTSAGDDGLEAFARSIGATRVMWNVGEPITQAYSRTYHAPVTESTRTAGTVIGPSGRTERVDVVSKTNRWVDRTVEGYESVYPHAAAFFAPER